MRLTEEVKVEEPFDGDENNIYYINGGRCSGKVNRTVNELVEYANNLQQKNKELQERINKAIEYINSQSPDAGVSGKHIKEILKVVE